MKTLATIALLSAALAGQAQTTPSHTLTVDIGQIKTSTGTVFIALQDADEKAVQRQSVPLKANAATVVFRNVPPGKYAVRFFVDENENRVLDKGIFGLPKEGWGCSNDVKGTFGPPKFAAMLFSLTTDKTIAVHVN